MRAGIYTRLSLDRDGTSTATARQQADCRAYCDARGWEVVKVYEDSDVSAYQKKVKRPEWERLLIDMADHVIDVVVVWRSDRLARQPRDLERFLDIADAAGGALASVTEPFDGTHAGTLMLRMVTSFAHHESAVKAERVARARREEAELGRWPAGGRRLLGYTTAGEIIPAEAAQYLDAVDRVLAGESAWMIAAEWNGAGSTTPNGARWDTSNLLRMLRTPRYAGLRVYQGAIMGEGSWEPLIDRARWEALQRAIRPRTGPVRGPQRYLLTGLLLCGLCGRPLAAKPQGSRRRYACRSPREGGCSGVAITADHVEDWVGGMALARLQGGGLQQLLEREQGNGTEDLVAQLQADEHALEMLAHDHHVMQVISRDAYLRTARELKDRMEATRRALAGREGVLAALPHDDLLQAEWDRRGVPWRRALLQAVIESVTVNRATKTGRGAAAAVPERLSICWRA